jgi:hypothetical protein
MDKLGLVLLVFAFVLFCISAYIETAMPAKLRAAGLAFFAAALVFGNIAAVFK